MTDRTDFDSVVGRLVAILRVFAEGEWSLSVKQVSELLDLPVSTTHRLLDQLVRLEIIDRAPKRRYTIGTEFFRLGALVSRKLLVVELARAPMEHMVRETGETCQVVLYERVRRQVMIADRIEGTKAPQSGFGMHSPLQPVWTAIGRSILAWLDGPVVRQILAEAEPSPMTGEPVPGYHAMQTTLSGVRRRGYAVVRGPLRSRATAGIAAPFFGPDGSVGGCLCIVAPESRCPPAHEPVIGKLLVQQTQRLSRALRRAGTS